MTPEERVETNLDALVSEPPTIMGRTLRPLTAGSLRLCRRVGLGLLTGAEGMSEDEITEELAAFAWLHWADLGEAKRAAAKGREKFFAEDVEAFMFTLPIAAIGQITTFLEKSATTASAAEVEALPKAQQRGESPPPNI